MNNMLMKSKKQLKSKKDKHKKYMIKFNKDRKVKLTINKIWFKIKKKKILKRKSKQIEYIIN